MHKIILSHIFLYRSPTPLPRTNVFQQMPQLCHSQFRATKLSQSQASMSYYVILLGW